MSSTILILEIIRTLIFCCILNSAKRCLIAITKNSLDIIINTGITKNTLLFSVISKTSIEITNNLSATGSKNSPKFVCCPNFRAINPSS